MNRRSFLLTATAFTLLSTTAARADYVDDIVKWLEREGYAGIEVSRTLLGRVRIVATKDSRTRELVCNPRTGEILRDVFIDADGEVRSPLSVPGDRDDDDSGDNSGHDGSDDNSGHDGGDDHEDSSGHRSGGDDDKSGHGGGDD